MVGAGDFLGGIIGQFGKLLTLKILGKFSSRKKEETSVREQEEDSKEDPKDLKKRAKAEKTRWKKEATAREKAK